jgi:GDPmannose 4,6-dehydratase
MRVALITGITGQDGSYLSELLLSKGYVVVGIVRRHSSNNYNRIMHLWEKLDMVYGDVTDTASLSLAFQHVFTKYSDLERLEVYNLAAQSHVKVSFDVPEYTGQVDALGTLRLLELIRQHPQRDRIRFYQASTSELYGKVLETPQTERTPFNPQSPYAIAKLYGFWMVKNYRDAYGLYAVNGILFNHTSPRRGENFVCRKITMGVAGIVKGKQTHITLGNMNSFRDLGHAADYVEGMWRMLQQPVGEAKDYVLSMKYGYTIRQLVEMAFGAAHIKIRWEGEGIHEIGVREDTGAVVIRVSEKYFRPAEVDYLLGDSSRAHVELGWETKYTTEQIIAEMVQSDIAGAV